MQPQTGRPLVVAPSVAATCSNAAVIRWVSSSDGGGEYIEDRP
ncbi:hypothetical protein [Streptomyces olivochromogenes]|nr:hypothetical protein [Streptomyces olivochromogenes]